MFNVTCLFLYPRSFECGQLKPFLHVSHLATVIVYSNVLDLSHNDDSVQRRIEVVTCNLIHILHGEAHLVASDGRYFDLHPLPPLDDISDILHTTLMTKL